MPTMKQWSERSTLEIKKRMEVVAQRPGYSEREMDRLRDAYMIASKREKAEKAN